MRILLPAHQGSSGGLGTVVRGLRRHLPEALGADGEVVVVGGEATGKLRRLVQEQVVLPRAAQHFDLVHLTDHRPLLASRTPFLLTVHDVFFLDRPEWFPKPVVVYKGAMLRAAVAKRPAAVVCVSEFTRRRFLAHAPSLPRERVRVIPPGVEPATVRATGGGDYFLTVSTIEPRKNHLGLLRAYLSARRAGLRLRWKVAGVPGYASRPIVRRLRAAEGVDVLGWTPPEELERLYAGARFVAVPSLGEGFGFPPLEAMRRGVPVVCSSGTALDETAGDAAMRVAPEDEERWAQALRALADDESARARLRDAGLVHAAGFDWRRAAQEYVAAYRSALAGRRQGDGGS